MPRPKPKKRAPSSALAKPKAPDFTGPAADDQVVCRSPGCGRGIFWFNAGERPSLCFVCAPGRKREPADRLVPLKKDPAKDKAGIMDVLDALLSQGPKLSVYLAARVIAVRSRIEDPTIAAKDLVESGALDEAKVPEALALAGSPRFEGLRRGTERAFADSVTVALQLGVEHLIRILPHQKGMVANMIVQNLAKVAKDNDGWRRSRTSVVVQRKTEYIGAPPPVSADELDADGPVH